MEQNSNSTSPFEYDGCEACRLFDSDAEYGYMYCKHLKRRITARKKICKHYDDTRKDK